ncbi:lipoprotein localization factor LolB [Pasteurellaceae bacterium RH1A]|nr:lipoprotein localization factor LolB [Pasteurellaceae bacterium RH1A]
MRTLMNFKSISKLSLLGGLLILAGCQSILDENTQVSQPQVQIPHNDPQWQNHLKQLEQIKRYSARGQFGYISKEPKERFSSNFDWSYQSANQFGLEFTSNLSSKSLKLQRTARGLTVSDNKGNSRTEADINSLMEEIVGLAFPIDQFGDWLKGLPKNNDQYIVNEQRQLAQFTYPINGQLWQATYVEYHAGQPALPKLIQLENGNQTLKIRVDEWKY